MQSWNTDILISNPYKKQLQYCNIGSHGLMNQKTINQTVKEQIMLNFNFFVDSVDVCAETCMSPTWVKVEYSFGCQFSSPYSLLSEGLSYFCPAG